MPAKLERYWVRCAKDAAVVFEALANETKYPALVSIEQSVTPVLKNRLRKFQGRYRVWCKFVADETGNDEQDIHELIKNKFGPTDVIVVNGHEFEQKKSTRHYTVEEWQVYLARFDAFMATDMEILLPSRPYEGLSA